MFTLVGSGHKSLAQTRQPMGKSIPTGAKWIKDSVVAVEPNSNLVTTSTGLKVGAFFPLSVTSHGVVVVGGILDTVVGDSDIQIFMLISCL